MRRVVTLLRATGDPEPISPQPGLADLALLVERTCSAQRRVLLEIEGEPRPLPIGADLAAYRIVQESLTNPHRHGAAARVRVAIRFKSASVELDISDNGASGRADSAPDSLLGHGLIGIRERVAMYGGHVQIGPIPGHGFRVRAVLPLMELPSLMELP